MHKTILLRESSKITAFYLKHFYHKRLLINLPEQLGQLK